MEIIIAIDDTGDRGTDIDIMCPEGIQPCNMKNRYLLKKIQETLYIGQ